MARKHGIIKTLIWEDEDFRALTTAAQRAYLLILSQPQINNCGVVPYTPKRWGRLATDDTPAKLAKALTTLERARFVVVDEEADEILVRTFIRHDSIEKMPQLVEAAKREYKALVSPKIRRVLADLYPDLFADPSRDPSADPSTDPSRDPSGDPSADPPRPREGARARRRAPAPSPLREESVVSEGQKQRERVLEPHPDFPERDPAPEPPYPAGEQRPNFTDDTDFPETPPSSFVPPTDLLRSI